MDKTETQPIAEKPKSGKGSGRGGKRAGAGRKPGSRDKRKLGIKLWAEQTGMTPLEVMLAAMRTLYAAATKDPANVRDDLLSQAVAYAKDAAPYVHPRLIAQELYGKGGGPLQVQTNANVTFLVPQSGRRVAPPAPANDAQQTAQPAQAAGGGN